MVSVVGKKEEEQSERGLEEWGWAGQVGFTENISPEQS